MLLLRLELLELRLERAVVDLQQVVAGLDRLAVGEVDLHQLAAHARLDGDGVVGHDRAEADEVDADVPLGRRGRHDAHLVGEAGVGAVVHAMAGAGLRGLRVLAWACGLGAKKCW